MGKLGFDNLWIGGIMAFVRTITYTILLNGRTHDFIKPERGLRQGDPLSHFLFILFAETLVNPLNNAEATWSLNEIRLSPSRPSVHHLLFADDSLLLCKVIVQEGTKIKRCLKVYGDVSGHVINNLKSSIIFGAKIIETIKQVIKGVLGITKEGGEGAYVGLPECFSGSQRNQLNFIQEKLMSQLHGWFAKSLSQGGKEILLKLVALALPSMQCHASSYPKTYARN